MSVSLTHQFVSAVADGADTSLVRPSNWNAEHTLALATNKLIGRATAGTGAAEEITLGTGLSFSGTTLNGTLGDVVGPSSAIDSALTRFDTTTGKLVKDSSVTLSDLSGSLVTFAVAAPAQISTAVAGNALTLTAASAVAGSSVAGAAAGANATLAAGDAARLTSGNANGGDIVLLSGAKVGTGTVGKVTMNSRGAAGTTGFSIDYSGVQSIQFGTFDGTVANIGALGFFDNNGARNFFLNGTDGLLLSHLMMCGWASSTTAGTNDTALARNAAGVVEVNNGTAGTFRDLYARTPRCTSGKIEFEDANGWISRTAASNVIQFAASANASTASLSATIFTLGSNGGAYTLQFNLASTSGAVRVNTIQPAARGANTGAGHEINLYGGDGQNTSTGTAGGPIRLRGGDGAGSNANNGGDVLIDGGAGSATGVPGRVLVGNTRGVLVTSPLTVATLPAASASLQGARSFVTDANATTFLSTVAGGGANKVPVVCNGTNWVIG